MPGGISILIIMVCTFLSRVICAVYLISSSLPLTTFLCRYLGTPLSQFASPFPTVITCIQLPPLDTRSDASPTISVASTITSTMPLDPFAFSNLQPPVDESVYSLTSEEAMFFKSQTSIDDNETLKQHTLTIQKKAYEAC